MTKCHKKLSFIYMSACVGKDPIGFCITGIISSTVIYCGQSHTIWTMLGHMMAAVSKIRLTNESAEHWQDNSLSAISKSDKQLVYKSHTDNCGKHRLQALRLYWR